MKLKISNAWPGLLCLLLVAGCYPNGAEYIDELDLVATIRDNSVNYDDYMTYVIPDTVMYITNDPDKEIAESEEQLILTSVQDHFNSLGWQESADPENNGSDVLITATLIDNVNVSVIYDWWSYWGGWGGWGWYPPYPPGGWYPWYPWYPGGITTVYAYREGTLIIEMVDPNAGVNENDADTDPVPVLWSGSINGLLEGSQTSINARLAKGLDQMFNDSPYLDKN
ncbi:DUF4136 domain-containing protein [Roseivirga pacifica]|uniref:DUF4136 domain-containing protein n=1 Tax=Roseivirga pacifica TaxID=1267423 RepID=UPI00227D383D|nr:DUF4136 domain-containing protein [Roseivirga pacifica]